MFRTLAGMGLLLGFTVPVFGGRPVWVMIMSNAFQASILPIITLAIIALLNNRRLMGEHIAGLWLNVGLWATFVFSLVTTYIGVLGFIESLANVVG